MLALDAVIPSPHFLIQPGNKETSIDNNPTTERNGLRHGPGAVIYAKKYRFGGWAGKKVIRDLTWKAQLSFPLNTLNMLTQRRK